MDESGSQRSMAPATAKNFLNEIRSISVLKTTLAGQPVDQRTVNRRKLVPGALVPWAAQAHQETRPRAWHIVHPTFPVFVSTLCITHNEPQKTLQIFRNSCRRSKLDFGAIRAAADDSNGPGMLLRTVVLPMANDLAMAL